MIRVPRWAGAIALAGVIGTGLAACGGPSTTTTASSTTTTGPTSTGAPNPTLPANPTVLAQTGDAAQHHPVDGIACQTTEKLLFHIHAHLAVFVNGRQRYIPYGIGIGPPLEGSSSGGVTGGPFVDSGSCFAWLHTHDMSGIIHIESPVVRTFTLGNFFDIWGQPLGNDQVGPAKGPVKAFLNGKPYAGAVRSIPLSAHNLIQLDVGTPSVAPQPFSFPPGL
jgi:hypothetical protein